MVRTCEVVENEEVCGGKYLARGMCKVHYDRWHRTGSTAARPIFTSVEQGFWFFARPGDDPEDHWTWAGKFDQDGYSRLSLGGQWIGAHRFACELLNGPRPGRAHVRHLCGPNPWCVNPNHLAWGTNLENMADRETDGNTLRGGRSPRSKLTEEVVLAIYRSTDTNANLAALYGVGTTTVQHIRSGNTWAHLTGHGNGSLPGNAGKTWSRRPKP